MPSLPAGTIVADASLLIAISLGNADAGRFIPTLSRCVITSVNFGEVLYMLKSKLDMPPPETERAFKALGVTVVDVTVDHVRSWPALKDMDAASKVVQAAAGVTKVKSLSVADMACLSFADQQNVPVLTGDKHWATLQVHGLTTVVFDFRDARTTP